MMLTMRTTLRVGCLMQYRSKYLLTAFEISLVLFILVTNEAYPLEDGFDILESELLSLS